MEELEKNTILYVFKSFGQSCKALFDEPEYQEARELIIKNKSEDDVLIGYMVAERFPNIYAKYVNIIKNVATKELIKRKDRLN
ncbi:MAG: hypothetical protein A2Y12_01430 [Planctomycetes bacterium GWF2_42_9]|nr:MAG: hypothetical protein A2Y12_01430 [Planctomycetes bacterium GWF2_42_9]